MNHGAGPIALVDVARDPACVDQLDGAAVAAVVLELSAVEARLAARLAQLGLEGRDGQQHDRLLTVDEVAATLGVSRDWVKRRGAHLPFTVPLSPGAVRFSE